MCQTKLMNRQKQLAGRRHKKALGFFYSKATERGKPRAAANDAAGAGHANGRHRSRAGQAQKRPNLATGAEAEPLSSMRERLSSQRSRKRLGRRPGVEGRTEGIGLWDFAGPGMEGVSFAGWQLRTFNPGPGATSVN